MLAAEKQYYLEEEFLNESSYKKERNEKNKKNEFSFFEKAKLIFLIIVLGGMCISMTISTAYISQIKHTVNIANKDIRVLEGEIENLVVKIEKENKIEIVEGKAVSELGMVYPNANQIVFLDTSIEGESDFASALRVKAFN